MEPIIFWKEEPQERKWKKTKNKPEDILKAISAGAMFTTSTSFEYEPGDNGQPEPIRYGDLCLDFDDEENPANALQDVKTLCLIFLPEEYDLDPHAIRFYASGSKGFHAEIPAELLGAQNGDQFLPLIFKELVTKWKEILDLQSLDLSLYAMGKGKMFRLPNVRRSNGRYKVPLTLEENRDLSIDQITELTKAPREIEPVEADLKPTPELVNFFTSQSLLFQNKAEASKDAKPPLTLDPVPRGQRNDKLARLVGRWIGKGIDKETIRFAAIGWWYLLPDKTDFDLKEVQTIVESVHQTDMRNHGEPHENSSKKRYAKVSLG
jgi:hypothetical protein